MYNYLKVKNPKNIAIFVQNGDAMLYFIAKLRFLGVNIDTLLVENIEDYDLSKYDYIITTRTPINSVQIAKTRSDKVVCYYLDKNQTIIDKSNEKEIAMVTCQPPLNYLKENGCEVIKDFGQYLILE